MSRPRIGVTGPDRGGAIPWWMTALALRSAGARPVRITPGRRRAIGDVDGLVIGGGSDLQPHLYGEERDRAPSRQVEKRRSRLGRLRRLFTAPTWLALRLLKGALGIGALEVDPERDRLELDLLESARENGRPVLGICRGCQLINVFFGGDLHQDLRGYDLNPSKVDGVLPKKPIRIVEGTRLHAVLGTSRTVVNSLHNQSVRDAGRGLRISAEDRDGIVQAVEHREPPFCLGVQWHPEYLPQKARQRRLFRRLVEAAKNR